MASKYRSGRYQTKSLGEDYSPDMYVERDGIIIHDEYIDSLFLNAHPTHWAADECDKDQGIKRTR